MKAPSIENLLVHAFVGQNLLRCYTIYPPFLLYEKQEPPFFLDGPSQRGEPFFFKPASFEAPGPPESLLAQAAVEESKKALEDAALGATAAKEEWETKGRFGLEGLTGFVLTAFRKKLA